MTGGLDKVNAGMYTVVNDVHAVDLVLGLEVSIESLLDVLNDRSPGIIVVDKVTESWCVNNSQSKPYTVLFNVCTDRLDRDGLWYDVKTRSLTFSWRIQRSVEKSVDEGRFS